MRRVVRTRAQVHYALRELLAARGPSVSAKVLRVVFSDLGSSGNERLRSVIRECVLTELVDSIWVVEDERTDRAQIGQTRAANSRSAAYHV